MIGASCLMGWLRLIQSAVQKGVGYVSSISQRGSSTTAAYDKGKQCVLSFLDHKTHLRSLLNTQPLRLLPNDLI